MRRRDLLHNAAATAAVLALDARGAFGQETALELAEPQPFAWQKLIEQARLMAGRAYVEPARPAPEIVRQIDYQTHGQLNFKRDYALFADGPGVYPFTFFHLGQYFQKSVKMHVLEGGQAREIVYSPTSFDMPEDSIARGMPDDAGFAGFRIHEQRFREDWRTQDWTAFLGASYFRAIGSLGQYGMSARGVVIDAATEEPEDFPDFVSFWFAPTLEPDAPTVVFALLDGKSASGAYRFAIRRTEGVVMDIDARLFLRRDVLRLGLAPLTSMFWYGEYNRPFMFDWRPEVHDSDGLALWTGTGERIWRPLNNPDRVTVSSFADDNPKGFGLLQRDRDVENYLDGVNYERRPSVWVEPLGSWGKGAVELLEIPTDDEIHDNIGAFWVPEGGAVAGSARSLGYRLHWLAEEPYPAREIARVTATRIGRGGEPGRPRPEGVIKFVVEFDGGELPTLAYGEYPEAVVTASRGEISYVFTEPVAHTTRWRAQFDLTALGEDPVEMRLFLERGSGQPMTETWLYQFLPSLLS